MGQISRQFHAILISRYGKDTFIIKNKQRKTFPEIVKFMDTDIGKWCITVLLKYKNRDKIHIGKEKLA